MQIIHNLKIYNVLKVVFPWLAPEVVPEATMLKSLKNFFVFNVYLFLRDRETERQSGGGQREKETQNLKQAPGSGLSAQSPTWGLNPRTVRS